MKRLLVLLPFSVLVAVAQDAEIATQKLQQMKVLVQNSLGQFMGVQSAVMGPTVKGAPYSATETLESTQTLGDGTHISQKTQTFVYRDSEGRIRRETPDQTTIFDPVANASYLLDPKAQTVRKIGLGMAGAVNYASEPPRGRVVTRMEYSTAGPAMTLPALPPPPPGGVTAGPNQIFIVNQKAQSLTPKTESLGKQTMEGVNAERTRTTSTIDVGAIGNDRPITITSETWYSPDLQTMVKSTHSDPRMGEQSVTLTGISRTEPAAYLFQVPSGYQVLESR